MATYPSTSTRATGHPFYAWEVPGKAISIQLHYDVIDRVLPEVMKGFGALPRRGAEVGGVLLGRIEPGFVQNVTIEDFQMVPCEYLMGPSYTLSERDRARLEETLQRAQMREMAVVGFFRSHTRKDLFLDDADVAICARYFPNPGSAFLVVKPFATRTSIAGFFFWEEGEIHRDSSYLEFPFHRRELGGGDPRLVAPQRELTPREAPTRNFSSQGLSTQSLLENPERPEAAYDQPQQDPFALAPVPRSLNWGAGRGSFSLLAEPDPAQMERKSSASRLLWAPLALAAAIVIGVLGFRSTKTEANEGANSFGPGSLPLRLTISENRNHVEMTWDRNAPAIAGSIGGLLSIQDGPYRRNVELSAAQLRDGRVRYSRMTTDVNLRLEVFSNSRTSVSESIRIVSSEMTPGLSTPLGLDPFDPVTAKTPSPRSFPAESVRRTAPRETPRPPAKTRESRPETTPPAPVETTATTAAASAVAQPLVGQPPAGQPPAADPPEPEQILRPTRRR